MAAHVPQLRLAHRRVHALAPRLRPAPDADHLSLERDGFVTGSDHGVRGLAREKLGGRAVDAVAERGTVTEGRHPVGAAGTRVRRREPAQPKILCGPFRRLALKRPRDRRADRAQVLDGGRRLHAEGLPQLANELPSHEGIPQADRGGASREHLDRQPRTVGRASQSGTLLRVRAVAEFEHSVAATGALAYAVSGSGSKRTSWWCSLCPSLSRLVAR